MTDGAGGDNGRVTLAILSTKLDAILEELRSQNDCNNKQDLRLNSLEVGQAQRQTQIVQLQKSDDVIIGRLNDHDENIRRIDGKTNWWNGANSVGAIIAGIVAYFRGP